jgi:peptidoglycan/LPS O-acetylase OafA/YrhL
VVVAFAPLGGGRVKHENNFNLLRLLAASQVVYWHTTYHLSLPAWPPLKLLAAQFPGVAMFFVISGFLVSDSCLRSTTGSFFFKRGLRIYPGLTVNIVILESLMLLTGGLVVAHWPAYLTLYSQVYFLTASQGIAGIFTSVGYVKAFFQDYPSGVLWTLTVELSFYLVLPAILALLRVSKPIGIALICAEMALSFAIASKSSEEAYNSHWLMNITIFPYFWIFAFGILARIYWDKVFWLFERTVLLWTVLYAVVSITAIRQFRIAPS